MRQRSRLYLLCRSVGEAAPNNRKYRVCCFGTAVVSLLVPNNKNTATAPAATKLSSEMSASPLAEPIHIECVNSPAAPPARSSSPCARMNVTSAPPTSAGLLPSFPQYPQTSLNPTLLTLQLRKNNKNWQLGLRPQAQAATFSKLFNSNSHPAFTTGAPMVWSNVTILSALNIFMAKLGEATAFLSLNPASRASNQ